MKIYKTVKGIAAGTSLAAFVTLGAPVTGSAKQLLESEQLDGAHAHAKQVGDKAKGKKDKKKDDKKKDENKKDEKGDEEGSCGEGSCSGKKDDKKK